MHLYDQKSYVFLETQCMLYHPCFYQAVLTCIENICRRARLWGYEYILLPEYPLKAWECSLFIRATSVIIQYNVMGQRLYYFAGCLRLWAVMRMLLQLLLIINSILRCQLGSSGLHQECFIWTQRGEFIMVGNKMCR